MLKILCNELNDDKNTKIELKIENLFLTVKIFDANDNLISTDIIKSLRSYTSYALMVNSGPIKIFRNIINSNHRFIDLSRLGTSIKLDFLTLTQLYGSGSILQVDTGIVKINNTKDIVIRFFNTCKENIKVISDIDFEIDTYNSMTLEEKGNHPRFDLWDRYSIIIDGKELKANMRGILFEGNTDEGIDISNREYIDIEIQKYKGKFLDKLTRDIDDDEVFVESTCGVLDTRRVYLKNGHGKFRLYHLGYNGPFKLKLGRKWYKVWNEYNLIMGKE